MSESIKVVVRIRPINSKEQALNCKSIVTADEANNQITIFKPDEADNVKSFAYDSVFSADSLQSTVYAKTAYSLVENILQGYNGTIFAYGQTGCGKTHSMVGKLDNEELQGIIPRSFGHILNTISETKNRQFLIRCSFIEIYNEEVRDLLGKDIKKSLEIKESPDKGVFIKDLSSNSAKTNEELMDYMNMGNKNRSVGETAMNKDSSRSHLLFMLYLESADLSIPQENRKYIASKLNLVDLAGSERINKTGAQGSRLQQAKSINLSLSALGNVISALVDGKSHHIPYRDSKLTRLLQDSLGGNTKTVMIANCSPADYNFDQTLSTLRYASRAKFIKNKPIINEDPKDALLKQYANQIKKLKAILSSQGGVADVSDFEPKGQGLDQQIRQKQKELANQKEETRMLHQRLKALEKQHLVSENVRVDKKIRQKINQARQSALSMTPVDPTLNDSSLKEAKAPSLQPLMFPAQQAHLGVENDKQIVKQLRYQIKSLENQIKDIGHENYLDKQMILGDIRELSKQNKLLEGILKILLSPKQLVKVKNKIQTLEKEQVIANKMLACGDEKEKTKYGYDQDKNQYKIPHFNLKEKEVSLPKLENNGEASPMELKNNSICSNNSKLSVFDGQNGKGNSNRNAKMMNCLGIESVSGSDKIKNNSFLFGKGKQNKKDLPTMRGLIQEARDAQQNNGQSSPPTKKCFPSHLQPLNKPEINQKLQKLLINEKQAKPLEKPRRLEKLANSSNDKIITMFGPIDY